MRFDFAATCYPLHQLNESGVGTQLFEPGIRVQLGDELNGFVAKTYVRKSKEPTEWLDAEVRRRYLKSPDAGGEEYTIGHQT